MNYDLIETNDASAKSNGGTEITLRQIYDGAIPREILENFQIIPSRVRDLKEDKIRILFLNDLPEDPESAKLRDENYRKKFHKIVFNSNWQFQRYQLFHGVPYDSRSTIIEVGLDPAPLVEKPSDIINIAYTSTPQRGLEILVPVFKRLAEKDPNIHLHVHSSFKIYGWEDKDKDFQALYEECQNHPQITYHGYTEHEELKKALTTYHIHGYPCIWLETACRAVLEAMSAGMIAVHPNFGALPDSTASLNIMYQGDMDKNVHAQIFGNYLSRTIELYREGKLQNSLPFIKQYVDSRYNIKTIQNRWEVIMKQLLLEYPPEARKLAEDAVFRYRTI